MVNIGIVVASVVVSNLFTVFCFLVCAVACQYTRKMNNRTYNEQIREIRDSIGVSISDVHGNVSAGDIAGNRITKT